MLKSGSNVLILLTCSLWSYICKRILGIYIALAPNALVLNNFDEGYVYTACFECIKLKKYYIFFFILSLLANDASY